MRAASNKERSDEHSVEPGQRSEAAVADHKAAKQVVRSTFGGHAGHFSSQVAAQPYRVGG